MTFNVTQHHYNSLLWCYNIVIEELINFIINATFYNTVTLYYFSISITARVDRRSKNIEKMSSLIK